jgi:hypothetical protein
VVLVFLLEGEGFHALQVEVPYGNISNIRSDSS